MLHSVRYRGMFDKCWYKQIQLLRSFVSESGIRQNFGYSDSGRRFSNESSVAIFWDLDNKPPNAFRLFDAAIRLQRVAQNLGFVKYMIAYANNHAFRAEKKALNQRETGGFIKPKEPCVCGVCGRRFYSDEKLMNHFKIHECEHVKRLNQIEASRGIRRVNLVGKYSMKMEKYRNASKHMLIPKDGYSFADELKQAGFSVSTVSDKLRAQAALRQHVVDMIDRRMIGCLVLVSNDSDFVGMLKEWKERCLKTVVVGDAKDGALKKTADASFSWQEIMMGKAKKEALSLVGKWKEHDVLKRLEWTYDPKAENKLYWREVESEDLIGSNRGSHDPWWKLETECKDDDTRH